MRFAMTPLQLLEPFTQHDASLSVVVAQGPVVARSLRDTFDRALPKQLDAEVLVVTALTHCAGEGSINQIAARLHRHRNTALHRPEKLRDLTGYEVRRPMEVARSLSAIQEPSSLDHPLAAPRVSTAWAALPYRGHCGQHLI
jgi:PucR C-terminal helix-turn-helix domain